MSESYKKQHSLRALALLVSSVVHCSLGHLDQSLLLCVHSLDSNTASCTHATFILSSDEYLFP